jgi:hypothetical protein
MEVAVVVVAVVAFAAVVYFVTARSRKAGKGSGSKPSSGSSNVIK